jgi:hypothetical protein
VIYRNSPSIDRVAWSPDANLEAVAIARRFLHGERELLRLARAERRVIDELQEFLDLTAELPVHLFRSANGNILLHAEGARESLMLTGKTAEVLRSYIDDEPVRMQDRLDMTQRRDLRA